MSTYESPITGTVCTSDEGIRLLVEKCGCMFSEEIVNDIEQ